MDRAGSILARWVLMLLCAPALTAGFVTTPLGGVYRGKLFVGSERLLLACRLARCCCKIHSLTYAVWVLSSMISLRCVEHHRVGGWLVGWVDICMAARHHLTSIVTISSQVAGFALPLCGQQSGQFAGCVACAARQGQR